jgi:uncharacterized paraquat-inducible protein A
MKTQCPECSAIFSAPDTYMGKTAKCPKCQKIFTVSEYNCTNQANDLIPHNSHSNVKQKTYICQNCGLDFDEPEKVAICSRTAYAIWLFILLITTFIGGVILYFVYYNTIKKVCPYCKTKCKTLLRSDSPMGIKLRRSLNT